MRRTSPVLPLSLPVRTTTLSPFLIFSLPMLQDLRRERDDLHEVLGPQLACDGVQKQPGDRAAPTDRSRPPDRTPRPDCGRSAPRAQVSAASPPLVPGRSTDRWPGRGPSGDGELSGELVDRKRRGIPPTPGMSTVPSMSALRQASISAAARPGSLRTCRPCAACRRPARLAAGGADRAVARRLDEVVDQVVTSHL